MGSTPPPASSPPPATSPGRSADWTRFALARIATQRTISLLAGEEGLDVMPFKGIDLWTRYGASPEGRTSGDIDLLVEPGGSGRARALLERRGYRLVIRGWSAAVYLAPDGVTHIDLHRLVLPLLMGTMTPRHLFARAGHDTSTFATPVRTMRACDHFVLVRVNHLKDRLSSDRAQRTLADLALLAPHTSPAEVGQTARRFELSIAAWMALETALRTGLTPPPSAVLQGFSDALRPTGLSLTRARASLRALEASRPLDELSYAIIRSSCDRPGRGLLSAGLSLVRAVRDRARGDARVPL